MSEGGRERGKEGGREGGWSYRVRHTPQYVPNELKMLII